VSQVCTVQAWFEMAIITAINAIDPQTNFHFQFKQYNSAEVVKGTAFSPSQRMVEQMRIADPSQLFP
jgi:hypothetical protein